MSAKQNWWRDAVVYQVYLRSFADSNGDGTGDIPGLISRLDYLQGLGVDAIWVNPWYESPLNDGGYDVADYRSIHPLFGTLEDARLLIDEASQRGLRLMVDLVPNHTSSEHRWFQAALAAPPGSPERSRYHFRTGRGEDGQLPPNDWRSVFGGPAWSRVSDGDWYLHLYDVTQPDLNWSNEEVRAEFRDILRFWLDFGAAGFRVDVAHGKSKDPSYPDLGDLVDHLDVIADHDRHPTWDRPELHEIVREWRSVLDEYDDRMMIAEAWVANWSRLVRYLRPGEYHQAFDFLFLTSRWEPAALVERIDEAIRMTSTVDATPTWVLSNHDVVRHSTRYGLPQTVAPGEWLLNGDRSLLDAEKGLRRARAATLLVMALPGSLYLYQGEELGLPEVHNLPQEVLDDPVWRRSGHTRKGRDGSRVPLPWTRSGPSFGFGSDGAWLPQPTAWGDMSVEAQTDIEGSTLELYRETIRLRKKLLGDGPTFEWIPSSSDVVSFRRDALICAVNFGSEATPMPHGEVVLTSDNSSSSSLAPDCAAWILE